MGKKRSRRLGLGENVRTNPDGTLKADQRKKGGFLSKVGGVISKAAPIAGLIPGIGIPLAAGLGAGGALLSGEGLGTALKRGAIGAAGGFGLSKLGGIGKVGGALGDFAKSNPELIAGGIAAIQNARTQGERDQIRDELLANARADRAQRQGFLNQVDLQGLRDIEAPDLSTVFADPNNPFFRSGRTKKKATALPVQGGTGSAVRVA